MKQFLLYALVMMVLFTVGLLSLYMLVQGLNIPMVLGISGLVVWSLLLVLREVLR